MKRSDVLKILLHEFPHDTNRCNQVLDLYKGDYENYWKIVHPKLLLISIIIY